MRGILALAALGFGLCGQSIRVQDPGPSKSGPDHREKGGIDRLPRLGGAQKIKQGCRERLVLASDALFGVGQTELTPAAAGVLGPIAPEVRKQSVHRLSIEGHTDGPPDDRAAEALSEKRARAVEKWLVSNGVLTPGVTPVHGFGNAKPVAGRTNPDGSDNPGGRARNRRVEIVIDTCKHQE